MTQKQLKSFVLGVFTLLCITGAAAATELQRIGAFLHVAAESDKPDVPANAQIRKCGTDDRYIAHVFEANIQGGNGGGLSQCFATSALAGTTLWLGDPTTVRCGAALRHRVELRISPSRSPERVLCSGREGGSSFGFPQSVIWDSDFIRNDGLTSCFVTNQSIQFSVDGRNWSECSTGRTVGAASLGTTINVP